MKNYKIVEALKRRLSIEEARDVTNCTSWTKQNQAGYIAALKTELRRK